MIRLVPAPVFKHKVRITVPGEPEPAELLLTFRHMTAQRRAEWFAQSTDKDIALAVADVVAGWEGVTDAEGKEIGFSAETLALFLNGYEAAANEILRAWMVALTESRLKN
jgi:hypothetical protein